MPSEDDYEFDDDPGWFLNAPEPPHGVRFGEGQPINRGGRPRGSPNMATMVRRVAMKRHRVKIDGSVRRKNTVELVVLAIRNKAALGDLKGFRLFQEQLQRQMHQANVTRGVYIGGEELTEDEFIAVHGDAFSDEEVEIRWPYMMRMRKKFREYQADIDRQIREAQSRTGGS